MTLALDTWRPGNDGAAGIRYTWATGLLECVLLGVASERPVPAAAGAGGSGSLDPAAAPVSGAASSAARGGLSTVSTSAPFTVMVDPAVPPVPDMNPDVPDWIRMKPLACGEPSRACPRPRRHRSEQRQGD